MKVYKPTASKGFVWSIALMLFVTAAVAVPLIISTAAGNPVPGFLVTMGVVLAVVLGLFGYFAWTAKNLRYEIHDQSLIIKWAFNQKIIPVADIRGINRLVGTSGTKVVGASLPGLHIGSFTNPAGKGTVNLFATRLWGEILLIRTKLEIIGITPENPEEFLEELSVKAPGMESDNLTGSDHEAAPFSPWKEKHFKTIMGLTAALIIGTGIYIFKIIPTLPARIPMHYNLYGQVDRYGSANELWLPFGIGVLVVAIMIILNGTIARNNRTSSYLLAYTSLFIAVLFSVISVSMG